MGRCYEFGVEIHAGCEHAMVVTPEGGACECLECGTVCPGRFGGCADVVAIPGRVPPSAPSWSIPSADARGTRGRPPPTFRGRRPSGADTAVTPARPVAPLTRRVPSAPLDQLAPAPRNGDGEFGADAPAATMAEILTIVTKLAEQQADYPAAVMLEAVESLRDEMRDRDEQLATSLEDYASYQRQLAEHLGQLVDAVDRLAAVVTDDLQRMATATERLSTGVTALEERLTKPATLRDLLGRRP